MWEPVRQLNRSGKNLARLGKHTLRKARRVGTWPAGPACERRFGEEPLTGPANGPAGRRGIDWWSVLTRSGGAPGPAR